MLNRRSVLLITILISIILVLGLLTLSRRGVQQASPYPIPIYSPSPGSIFIPNKELSPYLKTTIGQPADTQLSNFPNLKKISENPNGSTEYTFDSSVIPGGNSIITQGGVIFFEKERTVDSNLIHPKISSYIKQYGQPDEIIKGSKYYGWMYWTYIYANKGFALVGNPNSDEVFEIQHFSPMSVDQYKNLFGQDLNPNAQPPEEGLTIEQGVLLNFKASLPYYSTALAVTYDKSSDTTSVVIDQNHRDQGLQTLKDYLAKFGITDQSKINNLQITYQ